MFKTRSLTLALVLLTSACLAQAADAPTKLPAGVVAEQGGAQVTLAQIDQFAAGIPEAQRQAIFASPQRIESIIRGMLAKAQLLAEARQLKLEDRPQVKAAMRNAADEALLKARTDALRAQVEAAAPDMTELAHERYLSHPADYSVPAKLDVKHILIGTKDRSDADAKALAEKLYAQLQKDPSQFDADIAKYSDDPSKTTNHGLIPDATSDNVVEPFRVAAGKLTKIGQLTGPVKTQYGYHILELAKLTPARQKTFDEVKGDLVKKLHDDYVDREVQNHLDGVRNRKLDANMELVESLTTRYATPAAPAAAGAKK